VTEKKEQKRRGVREIHTRKKHETPRGAWVGSPGCPSQRRRDRFALQDPDPGKGAGGIGSWGGQAKPKKYGRINFISGYWGESPPQGKRRTPHRINAKVKRGVGKNEKKTFDKSASSKNEHGGELESRSVGHKDFTIQEANGLGFA